MTQETSNRRDGKKTKLHNVPHLQKSLLDLNSKGPKCLDVIRATQLAVKLNRMWHVDLRIYMQALLPQAFTQGWKSSLVGNEDDFPSSSTGFWTESQKLYGSLYTTCRIAEHVQVKTL